MVCHTSSNRFTPILTVLFDFVLAVTLLIAAEEVVLTRGEGSTLRILAVLSAVGVRQAAFLLVVTMTTSINTN